MTNPNEQKETPASGDQAASANPNLANGPNSASSPNSANSPNSAEPLASNPDRRVIPSGDLFGGEKTAIIEHAGEHYRLILTKNGKLLLQK